MLANQTCRCMPELSQLSGLWFSEEAVKGMWLRSSPLLPAAELKCAGEWTSSEPEGCAGSGDETPLLPGAVLTCRPSGRPSRILCQSFRKLPWSLPARLEHCCPLRTFRPLSKACSHPRHLLSSLRSGPLGSSLLQLQSALSLLVQSQLLAWQQAFKSCCV